MTKIATLVLALTLVWGAGFAHGGVFIKDGGQIAVLSGQSFEINSWSPSGYMRLLTDELAKAGVKKAPWIVLDKQKTDQMLTRLDSDVIANHPICALIIPGNSDYNAFAQKSVDESFTKNLDEIIAKLDAAHIKAVLVTSYASNSDLAFPANKSVGEHNDAIRALAKAHGLALIDFVNVVDAENKAVPFDGNPAAKAVVNQMFAGEVLRSFGESQQEIAACRKAWLDTPGAIQLPPSVSVNTYEKLKAGAKAAGFDVGIYMSDVLRKGLSSPNN